MKLITLPPFVLAGLLFAVGPAEADEREARSSNTLLAIFAHPDDESTIAPLLSKYVRAGATVHVVIATDGRLGATDFSGFEEGQALADARAREMRCSASALGVELTHLDYHDQLRAAEGYDGHIPHVRALLRDVAGIVERTRPDAIVTWGPDGGSNHMDHRLIGATVTGVFLSRDWSWPMSLFYYGTPSSQLDTEEQRQLRGVADRYLTTRVSYDAADLERAAASMRCHKSQWTEATVQQRIAAMKNSGRIIYLRKFEPPAASGDSVF